MGDATITSLGSGMLLDIMVPLIPSYLVPPSVDPRLLLVYRLLC